MFRDTIEFGDGCSCSLELTVVPIMSGRFWEKEDTDTEHQCPDISNAHGDAVRTGILHLLGAEINAVCSENADGDEQLITGDDCSSDGDGRGFGHVHWDQDGKSTDTETGYQTTDDDSYPLAWANCHLNSHTNAEHQAPGRNTCSSSILIGKWSGCETTDKGADGELYHINEVLKNEDKMMTYHADNQARTNIGEVVTILICF